MTLMRGATPECPLCGDPAHACGQPSGVVPVDERIERSPAVGALSRYTVNVNGYDTVMQLTAEEAKAKGGKPYKPAPPPAPAPDPAVAALQTDLAEAEAEIARLQAELEAATAPPEPGEAPTEEAPKAKEPANKARTAQNKAR